MNIFKRIAVIILIPAVFSGCSVLNIFRKVPRVSVINKQKNIFLPGHIPFELIAITPEIREDLKIPAEARGCLIYGVDEKTAFTNALFLPGEILTKINGKECPLSVPAGEKVTQGKFLQVFIFQKDCFFNG